MRLYFSIHVLLPIFIGSVIYLFFRGVESNLVEWVNLVGFIDLHSIRLKTLAIIEILPIWFKYNLSDGLWMYSLSSCIFLLFEKKIRENGNVIYFFIPLIGIVFELLQKIEFVPGTYDFRDMISYFMAYAISIITFKYFRLKKRTR